MSSMWTVAELDKLAKQQMASIDRLETQVKELRHENTDLREENRRLQQQIRDHRCPVDRAPTDPVTVPKTPTRTDPASVRGSKQNSAGEPSKLATEATNNTTFQNAPIDQSTPNESPNAYEQVYTRTQKRRKLNCYVRETDVIDQPKLHPWIHRFLRELESIDWSAHYEKYVRKSDELAEKYGEFLLCIDNIQKIEKDSSTHKYYAVICVLIDNNVLGKEDESGFISVPDYPKNWKHIQKECNRWWKQLSRREE